MKYIKEYQDFDDIYDDPTMDDPSSDFNQIIGHGKFMILFNLEKIKPIIEGLIRDDVDFDFYYENQSEYRNYLILLRGDWRNKIKNQLLPSTDKDQWYISPITYSDWQSGCWIKVDDAESFMDAEKYNL
jgi:hypothetical protein